MLFDSIRSSVMYFLSSSMTSRGNGLRTIRRESDHVRLEGAISAWHHQYLRNEEKSHVECEKSNQWIIWWDSESQKLLDCERVDLLASWKTVNSLSSPNKTFYLKERTLFHPKLNGAVGVGVESAIPTERPMANSPSRKAWAIRDAWIARVSKERILGRHSNRTLTYKG